MTVKERFSENQKTPKLENRRTSQLENRRTSQLENRTTYPCFPSFPCSPCYPRPPIRDGRMERLLHPCITKTARHKTEPMPSPKCSPICQFIVFPTNQIQLRSQLQLVLEWIQELPHFSLVLRIVVASLEIHRLVKKTTKKHKKQKHIPPWY